jgi:type VI secretion system protein ImpH
MSPDDLKSLAQPKPEAASVRPKGVGPRAMGAGSQPERIGSWPEGAVSSRAGLAALEARPHAFTLFAALRALEKACARQPRLGESRKAADDLVRLGQAPHLVFAPSDVASIATDEGGRIGLEQFGFGLFGPNGALPLHWTELAYERRHQKEDGTIVEFLNVFQHRLISLFYRAWAESEPSISLDRPDSDRFRTYIGALLGLAPVSAHGADEVADFARLSRAGRFSQQARSADGLEAILSDYFGIPLEVRPFCGEWLDIPSSLRSRLGEQRLGMSTTLGASTWQCQHKFEIVLGPLAGGQFENFLPGARGLTELHALVRSYTNDEWGWQVRLLLQDVDIPGAMLGKADGRAALGGVQMTRLGWMSWLGARRSAAQDVVIQDTRAASKNSSAISGALNG